MLQMIEANWLVFIAALLIGIAVAWWLFVHGSRPSRRDRRPDVLDEGAAPAQRNQALIDDAPPASRYEIPVHLDPPAMAGTMAGLGEVIAVAAQEEADNRAQALAEVEAEAAAEAAAEGDRVKAPIAPVGASDASQAPQTIAAEPDPSPAAPAPATEIEGVAGEVDDLRRIKGLGPKMLTLLHSLGITRFAQIAAWTDDDLDALDAKLGAFAGRPRRDSWVEQASLLSSGETGAYEARFGKL